MGTLDFWTGPIKYANKAARKYGKLAGNFTKYAAKEGYKKAKDILYGSYQTDNANTTSPALADPMFNHGEYFAYKFYNSTGKLPEMRHYNKVFGHDYNNSFFRGYISAANRMYESYKRDGKLLDDHALNLIKDYKTRGIIPKYHDIQISDAIRRANNPKVAPRLPPKVENVAKYMALPGGVLFASQVPAILTSVAGQTAAQVLGGAANAVTTDLLSTGLSKRHTELNGYKVPQLDRIINDIKQGERNDANNGNLPGHVWSKANINATKLALNQAAHILSRGSAPTSAPSGADSNIPISTVQTATIPTGGSGGGGGGGGFSSFFYNGRKRRYYNHKHSSYGYRRVRRGYRKNHKRYNKRYRKYRRFY